MQSTKKSKHYYSMFAFVQAYSKGILTWLVSLFTKVYSIPIDKFDDESTWTSLQEEKFRKFIQEMEKNPTIATLCHLMRLGLDNIEMKEYIRNNDSKSLRELLPQRLKLYLVQKRRRYFNLISNQIRQNVFLESKYPNFLSFLDRNKSICFSNNNYMANDEFVEFVHSEIKDARIARDEKTIGKSIQKRVYANQFVRELKSFKTYKETESSWDLSSSVNEIVNLLNKRIGFDKSSISTFHANHRKNIVNIFTSNHAEILPNDDPKFKYDSISETKLLESFTKTIENTPNDSTQSKDLNLIILDDDPLNTSQDCISSPSKKRKTQSEPLLMAPLTQVNKSKQGHNESATFNVELRGTMQR
ncbi:predicted protein [Naegleria gruberi]|uniref:Predicted protein n=1 Tax=Naegleria gruberi TaxID=5762 RepID=D2W5V3_NAEGR|nr:uncharacterized protein NAEGRDRAFT_54860 [Naegleria gruberi]EFC35548.1 predicted protein [Naegleria gruberi]|eukprot:XP_002668292.1 predicted protein [Naegleria gruberi strain NEG-M]